MATMRTFLLWIIGLTMAPIQWGVGAFAPTIAQVPRQSSALSATSGLTIYGHPGTRSPLINWACLELGLDFSMGDLRKNPHPFGQIPSLTDDNDVMVFESGAILQYLQQNYGSDTLSAKDLAAVTSWITWANASLDPICFLETPDGKVYDTGLRHPNKRIDRLDKMLANSAWLVGDGDAELFTLADVAVASYFLYVYQFFPDIRLNAKWPSIVIYLNSAVQRPAYAAAFGAPTQQRLLELIQSDMMQ